jgi:hypothetical protein
VSICAPQETIARRMATHEASTRSVACRLRRPNADHVALFLRIYPSRQQYRLPTEEEAGEVTKSLAEVGARPADP